MRKAYDYNSKNVYMRAFSPSGQNLISSLPTNNKLHCIHQLNAIRSSPSDPQYKPPKFSYYQRHFNQNDWRTSFIPTEPYVLRVSFQKGRTLTPSRFPQRETTNSLLARFSQDQSHQARQRCRQRLNDEHVDLLFDRRFNQEQDSGS